MALKHYSYRNENGKIVRGAAAITKLIYRDFGGPDNFAKHYYQSGAMFVIKNYPLMAFFSRLKNKLRK